LGIGAAAVALTNALDKPIFFDQHSSDENIDQWNSEKSVQFFSEGGFSRIFSWKRAQMRGTPKKR